MRKKKNSLLLPILLFIGVIAISIVAMILADNQRKQRLKIQVSMPIKMKSQG